MTTPDWGGLAEALLGTQITSEVTLEHYGALDYDEEDIEEHMLDAGIERCSNCGLWVESGEVIDEDGEIVPCGGCT